MIKRMFFLLFFILQSNVLFCEAIDLSYYEKRIFCQNGEDGVIDKLFDLLGTSSKYYVEFGGYDGYVCSNTRYLRTIKSWKGLMMDGDHQNRTINLQKEFITAENINELFQKYKVPKNLDLLSIDIDYNDFYVWKALDSQYQPKVVILEHNATHLPSVDKVVKYNPFYVWDGSNYFGASIKAFYHLGIEKGYSLVYVDSQGVNLFFVRNDLIKSKKLLFKDMNDVDKLYRYPKYGRGPNGGHKKDLRNRAYVSSSDILKK